MKRLLREPLLHFLLLGSALFSAYALLNRNKPSRPGEIVVSAGQIENLAATFAKVWQRPPSEAELKADIDQYVQEEMLSREAIALGLDKNDTVIRRRLQQKMEFIVEDFGAGDPADAELAEYLAKHQEQFTEEQRFTFRQVFLSPEKRGDRLDADAHRLLADLKQERSNADVDSIGDSFLLPHELKDEPQRGVAAQFGSEFATALTKVKPGEWSGPIKSAYGSHLVLVSQRTEGRLLPLEEVREQVKRELINERRLAANRKYLDELLRKYRVMIQWPKGESSKTVQTASVNK